MQELINKLMERSSGMASIIGQCLGTNKAVSTHLQDILDSKQISDELKIHLRAIKGLLDNRVLDVNTKFDELQENFINSNKTEPSNN